MKIVYIDTANFTNENRKAGREISLGKFYIWLKDKYKADKVILFTGYLKSKENKYESIKTIGYEYIFKEVVFNSDENKIKSNCDAEICVEGVRNTFEQNLDEAILVSSDGDFTVLIKFWNSKSVNVKVLSPAPKEKCSILLKRTQVSITYIDQVYVHFRNEKALDEDETS